jgi:hypothetical protein
MFITLCFTLSLGVLFVNILFLCKYFILCFCKYFTLFYFVCLCKYFCVLYVLCCYFNFVYNFCKNKNLFVALYIRTYACTFERVHSLRSTLPWWVRPQRPLTHALHCTRTFELACTSSNVSRTHTPRNCTSTVERTPLRSNVLSFRSFVNSFLGHFSPISPIFSSSAVQQLSRLFLRCPPKILPKIQKSPPPITSPTTETPPPAILHHTHPPPATLTPRFPFFPETLPPSLILQKPFQTPTHHLPSILHHHPTTAALSKPPPHRFFSPISFFFLFFSKSENPPNPKILAHFIDLGHNSNYGLCPAVCWVVFDRFAGGWVNLKRGSSTL